MTRVVRGQSLVEILVAILFLAAGGMALYTGSIRSVSEAAWGAERVLCEGLLNDLTEYYYALGFDTIRNGTDAPGVVKSPEKDPAKLAAREDAEVVQARKAIDEEVEALNPVANPADPLDPPLPAGDDVVKKQDKTIQKEWEMTHKALGIKRNVFFREDVAGERGTVTCIVKWKSRAGQNIVVHRQAVVFNAL